MRALFYDVMKFYYKFFDVENLEIFVYKFSLVYKRQSEQLIFKRNTASASTLE